MDRAINPCDISYELKINSRIVQGERNGDGAWIDMRSQEGGGNEGGEGAKEQATVPDESREDVSIHGFWKWGTSTLFDMNIVNLYTGSYLCQTYEKALAMADKEKKDKYFQPYLERRHIFTPMVYSKDIIP